MLVLMGNTHKITVKIQGLPLQIKVGAQSVPYIETFGAELAAKFFEQFGGEILDFSKAGLDNAEYIALVGESNARSLAQSLGFKPRMRIPQSRDFVESYRYLIRLAEEKDEADRSTTFEWTDNQGNVHSYVPTEDVAPYIEALGCERAAAFFFQFGGSPVYLSERDCGGDLRSLMSRHDVRRLVDAFGVGHQSRVPIGNDFLIKYFASKNWSRLSIGRQVRVSDEHVRRTLVAPEARKALIENGFARFRRDMSKKAGATA